MQGIFFFSMSRPRLYLVIAMIIIIKYKSNLHHCKRRIAKENYVNRALHNSATNSRKSIRCKVVQKTFLDQKKNVKLH